MTVVADFDGYCEVHLAILKTARNSPEVVTYKLHKVHRQGHLCIMLSYTHWIIDRFHHFLQKHKDYIKIQNLQLHFINCSMNFFKDIICLLPVFTFSRIISKPACAAYVPARADYNPANPNSEPAHADYELARANYEPF